MDFWGPWFPFKNGMNFQSEKCKFFIYVHIFRKWSTYFFSQERLISLKHVHLFWSWEYIVFFGLFSEILQNLYLLTGNINFDVTALTVKKNFLFFNFLGELLGPLPTHPRWNEYILTLVFWENMCVIFINRILSFKNLQKYSKMLRFVNIFLYL